MIDDLNLTLKTLLKTEAEPGSELDSANISFALPEKKWRNQGTGLVLNIYLYDIRENRNLRSNEIIKKYTGNNTVVKTKAPPRISCSYIISAWNKAQGAPSYEKVHQEHRLLSQVLQVLMRNPVIPVNYLQGILVDQEPDLPLVVTNDEKLPSPVEFWNAFESPLVASINCMITISLDLNKKIDPVPFVTTQITNYQNNENPEKFTEFIQIGGCVINADDTAVSVINARVVIKETNTECFSSDNGVYTFYKLLRGTYTFDVSHDEYESKTVQFIIPSPDGSNYNIKLSPK